MTMFIRILGLALAAAVLTTPAAAQEIPWDELNHASLFSLGFDGGDAADAESTVVKFPIPIRLTSPEDGRIGVKLRVPVYFAWNNVAFQDVEGDDIVRSLQTLTVTPGVELLIPAGQRWLVRPYAEVGAIGALEQGDLAWIAATGARASAAWDHGRWRFLAGGRLQYAIGFADDWDLRNDIGSLEIGGGAALPLWFEAAGDRPRAGLFVFPRWNFDNLALADDNDATLSIDWFVEAGLSFEWPTRPRVLGIKLPSWYGLGYRFGPRLRRHPGLPRFPILNRTEAVHQSQIIHADGSKAIQDN